MANFVFNIAKGRGIHYASLPAANDALIVVPLEATGIVSDAVMRDYADLASLLAGATNEQTTMGRKTVTSTSIDVDNTNDWADADFADVTWTAATGNPIAALVICYDPDTTGGTDSSIIPIAKFDYPETPTGSDIVAQLDPEGFLRAT